MRLRIILGVLAATAALAASGCGGSSSTSGAASSTGGAASGAGASTKGHAINLKIGFSGSLSGSFAPFDVPMLHGMQYAVSAINAAGGPVKVQLSAQDNTSDTQLTATQTQSLLSSGYKIQLIGVGNGRVAGARLVSAAGGLALAGLNTYPAWVQQAGHNAVMLTASDNIEGAAAGRYACDKGYKTVYTLVSNDTDYTKMPHYFADAFAKDCGGRLVGTDVFSVGATDYGAQVTKLKNASPKPDVFFSSIFPPDSNAFVKQARQAGVTTPMILADANYLPDFTTGAGTAGNGVVLATYAFSQPGSPIAAFETAFTHATGKPPTSHEFEAIGRDQIYALVQAAKQAQSSDPSKILAQLSKLPPGTLVALRSGKLDPTTRLPTTADVTMVKVTGGQFKPLANIVPTYIPKPLP